MRTTLILLRREIEATFFSFGFYVLLSLVAAYTAFVYSQALESRRFDMDAALIDVRSWLFILTLLLSPLLTMRLFAEEKRSGSIELLMTAPVADAQVVLAKYLAAILEFAVFLIPIWLIHAVLAAFFDSMPDWGRLAAVSLGMVSLGLVFIAVGTLTSALTSVQLWAALLAAVGNGALWTIGLVRWLVPEESAAHKTLAYMSLDLHLRDALTGIVDARHVVYQGSLVFLILFWTVRVVETRKWR